MDELESHLHLGKIDLGLIDKLASEDTRAVRMHGGAEGSGAPKENKNALKSGLYTKEAIEERKKLNRMLKRI